MPGDEGRGKAKEASAPSKWLCCCGHLCTLFSSGIDNKTRAWIQHCSRDTSYAGVCFGLRWCTMWCIWKKQDVPKLDPFICLPQVYSFQLEQGPDLNQFFLLSFSGKKGEGVGWTLAPSYPLPPFGGGFCRVALSCRLKRTGQTWLFCLKDCPASPRILASWCCTRLLHGYGAGWGHSRAGWAQVCGWCRIRWGYFVLMKKKPNSQQKVGTGKVETLPMRQWSEVLRWCVILLGCIAHNCSLKPALSGDYMCASLTHSIFSLTGFSQFVRVIWGGGWMHFARASFWMPWWSSATLLNLQISSPFL